MTDIDALIAEGVARYNAMSPVERALHDVAQKRSFIRGQMGAEPAALPEFVLVDALTAEHAKVEALEADATRWREVVRQCAEADDALNERLTQIGGCGDGNCRVHVRGGQHTNGGCRCMTNRWTAERTVMAHRVFQGAVQAALTRFKQESGHDQ